MSDAEPLSPLDELSRENEIARGLIERLAEMAQGLRERRSIPTGRIAEGVRLLAQYRGLHGHRFHDDLEPEARPVAMTTCFAHLDNVDRAAESLGPQADAIIADLGRRAPAEPGADARLADELEAFAQPQYEALQYEADYPLACLQAALPDEAAVRVGHRFERDAGALADLEGHIARYLARAFDAPGEEVPVRCRAEGCTARAGATSYPASDGHFGLRAPSGWVGVQRPPRPIADRTVGVEIDFYCPQHGASAPRPGTEPLPSAAAPRAPKAPAAETESECPCCDPVPANLA